MTPDCFASLVVMSLANELTTLKLQQEQAFDIVYLASLQFCLVSFACLLNGVKAFKDVWHECAQTLFPSLDILPRTSALKMKRKKEKKTPSLITVKTHAHLSQGPQRKIFDVFVFLSQPYINENCSDYLCNVGEKGWAWSLHKLWRQFQVQMAFQIERISVLLQIQI